jgi:hypothetical protein
MPIATEIAILKLKPDATIQDASSASHKKLQELLSTVSKVKGCVGQYWVRRRSGGNQVSADLKQGVQVEDATKYVWTIGEYRCPL